MSLLKKFIAVGEILSGEAKPKLGSFGKGARIMAGEEHYSPSSTTSKVKAPKVKKVKPPKPPKELTVEDFDMDIRAEKFADAVIKFPFKTIWFAIKSPFWALHLIQRTYCSMPALRMLVVAAPLAYFATTLIGMIPNVSQLDSELKGLLFNDYIWYGSGALLVYMALRRDEGKKFRAADSDETMPKNIKEFRSMARKAWWGNVHAQRKLGECYLRGYGVNADALKAMRLFLKAVAKGSQTARLLAGEGYVFGYGQFPDYRMAISYLDKFAKKGNTKALVLLNQVAQYSDTDRAPSKWATEHRFIREIRDKYYKMAEKFKCPEGVFEQLGGAWNYGQTWQRGDELIVMTETLSDRGSIKATELLLTWKNINDEEREKYTRRLEELKRAEAEKTEATKKISDEIAAKLPARFNKNERA